MAIDIYIFRHAETTNNLDGRLVGGRSDNLDLTERGISQAYALGNKLKREEIQLDRIYASTSQRVRKTLDIVTDIIGYKKPIIFSDELLELSQGDWEGKAREEVYTSKVWKAIKEAKGNFRAPNGESPLEAGERIFDFIFDEVNSVEDGSSLGFFGHGFSSKSFIAKVLGICPEIIYRISIDNGSLSCLRYIKEGYHKGWSLVNLNDTSHLIQVGFKPNIYS